MAVANIAVTEFTTSAVAVFLLQKLKSAKWFPLVEAGKAWASRFASIFLAAIGAIGVNYTWTPNPDGTHGLLIVVPTLSAILVALWHWINHYAMQETIYQATANKVAIIAPAPAPPPAPKV